MFEKQYDLDDPQAIAYGMDSEAEANSHRDRNCCRTLSHDRISACALFCFFEKKTMPYLTQ